MPPSDLDITRTAHLWIQQQGDSAMAMARATTVTYGVGGMVPVATPVLGEAQQGELAPL